MRYRLLICALLTLPVTGCAGIAPLSGDKQGIQRPLQEPRRRVRLRP